MLSALILAASITALPGTPHPVAAAAFSNWFGRGPAAPPPPAALPVGNAAAISPRAPATVHAAPSTSGLQPLARSNSFGAARPTRANLLTGDAPAPPLTGAGSAVAPKVLPRVRFADQVAAAPAARAVAPATDAVAVPAQPGALARPPSAPLPGTAAPAAGARAAAPFTPAAEGVAPLNPLASGRALPADAPGAPPPATGQALRAADSNPAAGSQAPAQNLEANNAGAPNTPAPAAARRTWGQFFTGKPKPATAAAANAAPATNTDASGTTRTPVGENGGVANPPPANQKGANSDAGAIDTVKEKKPFLSTTAGQFTLFGGVSLASVIPGVALAYFQGKKGLQQAKEQGDAQLDLQRQQIADAKAQVPVSPVTDVSQQVGPPSISSGSVTDSIPALP